MQQPGQGRAQPPAPLGTVALRRIRGFRPPQARLREGGQGLLRHLQAMREQAKGPAVVMRLGGGQVPAEGHQAVQALLPGPVHHPHAALADLLQQFVVAKGA